MYVLHGPSGVGKTTIADTICGGPEHVYRVRYAESGDILRFEGYDAGVHRCLLFDEFEGQVKLDFWKQICDRWQIRVRNFGGDEEIRPSLIFFTSNVPIDEWWSGRYADSQAHHQAIQRRITEVVNIRSFADADRFCAQHRREWTQPEPAVLPRPDPLSPAFGGDDIDLSDIEWPDAPEVIDLD